MAAEATHSETTLCWLQVVEALLESVGDGVGSEDDMAAADGSWLGVGVGAIEGAEVGVGVATSCGDWLGPMEEAVGSSDDAAALGDGVTGGATTKFRR